MLLSQVSGEKEFFAKLVVDAVSVLDPQTLDLKMIGVKKVGAAALGRMRAIAVWFRLHHGCRSAAPVSTSACRHLFVLSTEGWYAMQAANQTQRAAGLQAIRERQEIWYSGLCREQTCCYGAQVQGGGLRDSFLVDGVAFKKTFSYAGFEMQPRSFDNPQVLILNIELELKSEKENAEVRRAVGLHCWFNLLLLLLVSASFGGRSTSCPHVQTALLLLSLHVFLPKMVVSGG